MAKKTLCDIAPKSTTPNPVTNREVCIAPPNFQTAAFKIKGTAPLVINKFSAKARAQMLAKHMAGSQSAGKKIREAKNPDQIFNDARHISTKGWDGIPAATFRHAMIGACRLTSMKMTMARISFFIEGDGFDADEGTPLVKIIGDKPRVLEMITRNETGVPDVRFRPQWLEWGAIVRVRFDLDQLSLQDVTNLLARAGGQCGICEGRPSSESGGMGWGLFEIEGAK